MAIYEKIRSISIDEATNIIESDRAFNRIIESSYITEGWMLDASKKLLKAAYSKIMDATEKAVTSISSQMNDEFMERNKETIQKGYSRLLKNSSIIEGISIYSYDGIDSLRHYIDGQASITEVFAFCLDKMEAMIKERKVSLPSASAEEYALTYFKPESNSVAELKQKLNDVLIGGEVDLNYKVAKPEFIFHSASKQAISNINSIIKREKDSQRRYEMDMDNLIKSYNKEYSEDKEFVSYIMALFRTVMSIRLSIISAYISTYNRMVAMQKKLLHVYYSAGKGGEITRESSIFSIINMI